MLWIAFALGVFLGTFLGILVLGLCHMAARPFPQITEVDADIVRGEQ